MNPLIGKAFLEPREFENRFRLKSAVRKLVWDRSSAVEVALLPWPYRSGAFYPEPVGREPKRSAPRSTNLVFPERSSDPPVLA